MENMLGYSDFGSLLKSNEFLLEGILFCGILIILFMWIERKIRAESSTPPLPGLKCRPYNPYGNFQHLPTKKVMNGIELPPSSFVLQILLGHAAIFYKKGIFHFSVGINNFAVLIKGEYVEELLNNSRLLEKGDQYRMLHPWLGTGLLTSHGSKWKSRRKLLTHSFHFDILKEFLPIFDEQSKILVDILKQKANEEWLDIIHLITLCSLDIICETTLGGHIGAQKDSNSDYVQAVLSASEVFMKRAISPFYMFDIPFRFSSLGRQFKKDLECLHGFTRKVIQQKKDALKSTSVHSDDSISRRSQNDSIKRKRKALMDLLLDIHMSNQEFTEEDVREEIDTFAFEGHDTTSMGMSWALYLIGLYPEIQNNIHEELDRIFAADLERPVTVEDLKEMQYLERVLKDKTEDWKIMCELFTFLGVPEIIPSVPFFSRKADKDFNLREFQVKKGCTIVVNNYLLHRNPETFPNPEKFDPDRFLPENCVGRNPFAYVPFSAGPRNCIGQRFAIMEEKTVISNVLRNFHVKSLEHRDRLLPITELILRSAFPLKLKFIPRDYS